MSDTRLVQPALVRWLQLVAIRTNVVPMSLVYSGIYRLVRALTVTWLGLRFGRELASVYQRGSAVIDTSVPGLSDIDLTVVLDEGVGDERRAALAVAWQRIAAWVPLLEDRPWILTRTEFSRLGAENPSVRYRIMEAQQSWELVRGSDAMVGLDCFSRAQRLQAIVDDLGLRLTYLNGMLFGDHPDDPLHAIQREYTLYKLVLDLARADAFDGSGALPSRAATSAAFLRGELKVHDGAGPGDAELRAFIAWTRRYRLRRLYFAPAPRAAIECAGRLVELALRTLRRAYDDAELIELPGVREQAAHFYGDGNFLPEGLPVRWQHEWPADDFPAFCAQVQAARRGGTHTVLVAHRLWLNLANTNPALGNCTVVPAPD